jgi:MFS-type transporter involved in bile tolerance (Atg22 family)
MPDDKGLNVGNVGNVSNVTLGIALPGSEIVVAVCGAVTSASQATIAVVDLIKFIHEKTPAAQLEAQSKLAIEALKPLQAAIEGFNKLFVKKEG